MVLRARSSPNGEKQISVAVKWTRSILRCRRCGKLPRQIKKNNSRIQIDVNPIAECGGIFYDGIFSGASCDADHRSENRLVATKISINAISALPNSRGMPEEI